MDQWAEQTSLQLMELIASTSGDAQRSATASPTGPAFPAVDVLLRALAASDDSFRRWLEQQSSDHWLVWLANATPRGLGAQAAPLINAAADASGANGCAAEAGPGRRLMRLVSATATLALEKQHALQAAERSKGDVARRLAYDMAYGLSHELNNPLANIASRARLLAEEEPSERKRQLLSGIVDQAMRGCEMIADLMWVARPPQGVIVRLDLGSLVHELIEQARPWTDARGLQLGPSPSGLAAGAGQLTIASDRNAAREAIWALLRNAIEAARQRIVIALTVEAPPARTTVACTQGEQLQAAETMDQAFAVLRISDDGPGLSEQAREHAFNPYFSGREAGRGLGLGLAKADRIARLAGGYVTIDNQTEGGCVACIAWPCTCGNVLG